MNGSTIALVAGAAVLLGALALNRGGPPPDAGTSCASSGSLVVDGRSIRYVQAMTGGATALQDVPVLVFFHSRGTKPDAYVKYAQRLDVPARVILPEGPGTVGGGRSWFTLRANAADQNALASQMQWTGDLMVGFLQRLRACVPGRRVDALSGFSQGASMALMLAARRVAPSSAISGWIPTPLWNASMSPTVEIHGFNDTTVPYASTALWAAEMVARGAPLQFLGMPGGHEPTAEMLATWKIRTEAMLS